MRPVLALCVLVLIAVTAWHGWRYREQLGYPHQWYDDDPQIRQRQIAHVRAAFPTPVTLGWVCDAPGMEAAGLAPLKEYVIAQYVLTPHLLVRNVEEPLQLVDLRHADPARLRDLLPWERDWAVLRDFGNGLLLVGRRK